MIKKELPVLVRYYDSLDNLLEVRTFDKADNAGMPKYVTKYYKVEGGQTKHFTRLGGELLSCNSDAQTNGQYFYIQISMVMWCCW